MSVSGILNVSATAIQNEKGRGRENEKVNWIVDLLVVSVLRGLKALVRFLLTTTISTFFHKVSHPSVLGNLVRKVHHRWWSKVLV